MKPFSQFSLDSNLLLVSARVVILIFIIVLWIAKKIGENKHYKTCDPFLKNLMIGHEKWIIYDNFSRKRSRGKSSNPLQTTSKGGLHTRKVLLSVWWDIREINFWGCFHETRQ